MAYHPKQREDNKPKITEEQVAKSVAYLSNAFNKATRSLGNKNQKGTELYDLQVEFAWLLHEIANGPRYIFPKRVEEANQIISELSPEATDEHSPPSSP